MPIPRRRAQARRRRLAAVTLGVTFTVAPAGCASTSDAIRGRYAREYACPESQVSVSDSGGTVYRAVGCGRSAEYVCGSFAGGGKDPARGCEERGGVRPARGKEEEPMRVPSGTDPEPAPGQVRK